MKIGEQLKQQRGQRAWSQQDLADRLKISRQSISKWEQGTALPSFANIILLSEVFGVTIDELIRGDARLLKRLERPVTGPLSLIILGSLGLAILLAPLLLSLRVSVGAMTDWAQTPLFVGIIGLLVLVYQRQGRYPLSRWVIGLAVLIMTLLLVPQVADTIIGFGAGLRGIN